MKKRIKVAYCTGFWCTNIGNGFFSLGVEYALKKMFGEENVTIVSDLQTYTTSYGKRLHRAKNQIDFISNLNVDYVVLAGPVLSKYFLELWKEIIIELNKRNIGYILLSAGIMKMNKSEMKECQEFMRKYPPYILCSRDRETFESFSDFAVHSYDGICFSFFTPDFYFPASYNCNPYWIYNFDKIDEPVIKKLNQKSDDNIKVFEFNNEKYTIEFSGILNKFSTKTDRFTDALIYIRSFFPKKKRKSIVDAYTIIRTDHRFHPHFRTKIYSQENSFCADLPYGYINLYANSKLTMSDRVHACAVTLAYGNSAMLFSKTNRSGLLERVGADKICNQPTKIDLEKLKAEKENMISWIKKRVNEGDGISENSN